MKPRDASAERDCMQRPQPRFKRIKAAWLLACFGIGLTYFGRGSFTGESMADLLGWMALVSFPSASS